MSDNKRQAVTRYRPIMYANGEAGMVSCANGFWVTIDDYRDITERKDQAEADAHALVAEAYEVASLVPMERLARGDSTAPVSIGSAIQRLTPALAAAARDARDEQVRNEALREAAAAIKEHTDTARKKMRMAYGTPSSGVWSAIISHLDIEHDRILAMIEKDQTNE